MSYGHVPCSGPHEHSFLRRPEIVTSAEPRKRQIENRQAISSVRNLRRPVAGTSWVLVWICATALVASVTRADAQDQTTAKHDAAAEVEIYPLLIQAPIFGATIKLPALPGGGGEAGEQSGSTDFTLNSAYMAGLTVRGRQWFAEARGTWMDLSASFSAPRLQVDSKATLFNARGGIRLADGLFATGGVRRVGLTLDTQLSLPALGVSVQGTTKPALWDPLIGVDWRHPMGHWIVDGNFQGGGFGVGTDVDLSGEANASWRGIPHTEIRLGFSVVYYKLTVSDVSIGSFQRTLISTQTLYGPIVGFGFYF